MIKGKQGFASMDPKRTREIAALGGRSQGKHNNRANFANDPDKARRAGSIGGKVSRRGPIDTPLPTELRQELADA